jgi:hypothetical protein
MTMTAEEKERDAYEIWRLAIFELRNRHRAVQEAACATPWLGSAANKSA